MNKITFPVWNSTRTHCVDLSEVLGVIGEKVGSFSWYIEGIYGVGKPGTPMEAGMLGLEKKVQNFGHSGMPISWSHLVQLANELGQTLDCKIRGGASDAIIEIELNDSTMWTVTTTEESLVSVIRHAFL
jgi:hypothetical protein